MMWAATVRRCPTNHVRHQSQFGARMQLARALNHAPYLIYDGVYSACPPPPPHFDAAADAPRYSISCTDPPPPGIPPLHDPDIICDHVVDCESSVGDSYNTDPSSLVDGAVRHREEHLTQPPMSPPPPVPRQSIYRVDHPPSLSETPYITYPSSRHLVASQGGRGLPEMRVELPYSRREFDPPEDYHTGEPIVRRYEDFRQREDVDTDRVVSLSYQQRSMGGPYGGGQVWGAEPSMDCWGDRPLLLKRGKMRETVRTCFVVGLSITGIIIVIMTFGVYNMLITTLFLFFLLSTVSLLIFLLMRKPSCFNCCREPFDLANATEEDSEAQQGLSTYLTEAQGGVQKKRLSDSPPPYESPPDYHSLPPEVLVTARGLESSPESLMARVHGTELPIAGRTPPPPRGAQRRSRIRRFAAKSSSSLLASAAPLLSGSARNYRVSPPPSPPMRPSDRLPGLTSSFRGPPPEGGNNNNRTGNPYTPPSSGASVTTGPPTPHHHPPPPPYECVVIRTDKPDQKRC